jgi:hypothetical protein
VTVGGGYVMTADVWPAGGETETFPGQLMTGGTASRTLTKKKQRAVFSDESRALQVTSVAPGGNVDPEGGAQDMLTSPHSSKAVGAG